MLDVTVIGDVDGDVVGAGVGVGVAAPEAVAVAVAVAVGVGVTDPADVGVAVGVGEGVAPLLGEVVFVDCGVSTTDDDPPLQPAIATPKSTSDEKARNRAQSVEYSCTKSPHRTREPSKCGVASLNFGLPGRMRVSVGTLNLDYCGIAEQMPTAHVSGRPRGNLKVKTGRTPRKVRERAYLIDGATNDPTMQAAAQLASSLKSVLGTSAESGRRNFPFLSRA